MKKASGKSKGKTSKPAKKKHSPKSKKPIDLVEVRKDITEIVGSQAAELARAVVEEGRKGQLAPVKYLFEMTGLYPAAGGSSEKPEEASLAKTLLHRLGMPADLLLKPPNETALLNPPTGKSGSEDREEESSGTAGSEPDARTTEPPRKIQTGTMTSLCWPNQYRRMRQSSAKQRESMAAGAGDCAVGRAATDRFDGPASGCA